MAISAHTINVDASNLIKSAITVRITLPRFIGLRFWLIAQLVRMAGLISPVTIEVITIDDLDQVEPRTRSWQMIGGNPVPRQLAFNPGSPLYRGDWATYAQGIDIYLDGEKQVEVLSYDCDEGFVRKNRLVDGEPVVKGGEIETVVLRGKVELRVAGSSSRGKAIKVED